MALCITTLYRLEYTCCLFHSSRITSVKKHMFSVKELVKVVFALHKHKVFSQLTSNEIYWHRLHKQRVSDEANLNV